MRLILIYIDLDNFKVYNDVYGFDNGDRIILFTAQAVRDAVEQHGSPRILWGMWAEMIL